MMSEIKPPELETRVGAAVKEATQRLQMEADQKLALQSKQHEGEKNVLTSQVEGLQSLVETQKKQVEELTRQQTSAYEKVQDIANRAVERTSNFITVPGPTPPPHPGKE